MKTKAFPEAQTFGKKKTIVSSMIPMSIVLDEFLPKPVIPKRTLQWENDLELRSKFLDRRVSQSTRQSYLVCFCFINEQTSNPIEIDRVC